METTGRRMAMEELLGPPEARSTKIALQDNELLCSSFEKQANGPACSIAGVAVKSTQGPQLVIDIDSDDTEFSDPGSAAVNIHRLCPTTEESLGAGRGGTGRYSGRLRERRAAPKKYHSDFIPVDEIFLDHSFASYLQEEHRHSSNAGPLPSWGARKPRKGDSSQSKALPDHDRIQAPELVTRWSYDRSSNDFELLGRKEGHRLERTLGSEQAVYSALNHDNRERSHRSRQPWHNLPDNSVPRPRTVRARSRSLSIERNSSSCKLNNSACIGNMVTHVESFPRDLGGRYEGPVAPAEPSIRKRKVGVLADERSEYKSLSGLANHRSWSDSIERPVQREIYELSSDGDEVARLHFRGMEGFLGGVVAEQHSRGMQEFLGQEDAEPCRGIQGFFGDSIPLQESVAIRNLHVDDNLDRGFPKDPQFAALDEFVLGSFLRKSSETRLFTRVSPGYVVEFPVSLPHSNSQGDVFMTPGNIAFGTASELSASDSLEPSQTDLVQTSDEDYYPPGQHSVVQPHTDNAGNPILTDHSSRTRRLASSGGPERVRTLSDLVSGSQPASVTPSGVTPPLSNRPTVVCLDPNLNTGDTSLGSRIIPASNGTQAANLDVVRETDEANDPTLLDDDDEEEEEEEEEDESVRDLFDLNELPEPEHQPRKTSKARKKHRPKVFREGRPYRARKPKKPEDETSRKKPSEGKKMGGEKLRGRKKLANPPAATNLTQDNSLGKQGGHGGIALCSSGFAIAKQNEGMHSSVGLSVIAQDGSPSRVEYVNSEIENAQTPVSDCRLGIRANNTLIVSETLRESTFPHARDCSPLSTSSSASPSLSRKRTVEREGLTCQPGVRRVLFKKARGKMSGTVVEHSVGFGENLVEPTNRLVDPNFVQTSSSVALPVAPVRQKRTYTRRSQANGSVKPSGKTRRRKQTNAAVESQKRTPEGEVQEGSGVTLDKSISPSASVRMSTATRSKPVNSSLADSAHDLSTRSGASEPRLVTQADMEHIVSQIISSFSRLGFDENATGLEIVPHVNQQKDLVVYEGPFLPLRRKKPRARVMLDGEDKRVWRLLMAKGTDFEDENSEKDAPKQWEEERAIMKSRAETFINRMHLVQGDRRFSVWKGSVVDSVVGAFLTQNVSDHLSSSAFMALAARFPAPRKKKTAPEVFQETVVTEFQVEEALGNSEDVSRFPVSTVIDATESVNDTVPTTLHLEDAIDISEKSSITGGGSSVSCNQHDIFTVSTKVKDCNPGWEPALQSLEKEIQSTSEGLPRVEWNDPIGKSLNWSPDDGRELNSSCSSKDSHSECNSCLQNLKFSNRNCECLCVEKAHLVEDDVPSLPVNSSQMIGSGQQEPGREGESSSSIQSELEELFFSSVHSPVNSNPPRSLLNLDEQGVSNRTPPLSKTCFEENSRVLLSPGVEPFLVVDLSLSADDIQRERLLPQQQHSFGQECLSQVRCPITYDSERNSVPHAKNWHTSPLPESSGPLGFERNSAADGEVGANIGSVICSSNSCESHKASLTSLQPGSEVNCVTSEEVMHCQGRVIFSSDSFDTNKVSEKQLVPTTTEDSEDAGAELPGNQPHGRESSNLHSLKVFMRKKSNALQNVANPNSLEVNMDYSSQLTNISSSNQEREVQGPKKLSFVGLSGLERARLEQAHTKSKVAVDWEAVRLKYNGPKAGGDQSETPHIGCKSGGSSNVENGVDWDAVRLAKLEDIAHVIKERGMNNVLAGRIKAFLERVQKEHGSVDLEWLRTVSVEEAKSFLLSVRGLGLKSVECIRLLTLHHLAFPVDTNVGRICVRLGWVPLEPLPEELQLHLLELYPVQETIQKYLWPRLCSLDQRTLYELHYQMITFGKVFCTKSRPNCNACPMSNDCQHFASALASARLALPAAPHDGLHSPSSEQLALPAAASNFIEKVKLALPPLKDDALPIEEGQIPPSLNSFIAPQTSCEPIIEEPATPEHRVDDDKEIDDIEQLLGKDEDCDTFVGVSSQPQHSGLEKNGGAEIEIVLPKEQSIVDSSSKALVLLHPGAASLPVPKLKNVGRLRTVHYVYELPDNHPLLDGMDDREPDDPCFYLLAIWSPGESPEAPPVLDDVQTNGTCDGFNSSNEETVKGTVLVPCRTAMHGIFPLNGTYFQVNEVFADHASSLQPIEVPRNLLWNLRRRFVYFGTSVTTIFKGLSTEEIQACFWRGYVCVRGFDGISRCPRPLAARLHFPASKIIKKPKGDPKPDVNTSA